MRSCNSGWAAVVEAITTAGTPTTDCVERAGTADIVDSRLESEFRSRSIVFATLPFQTASTSSLPRRGMPFSLMSGSVASSIALRRKTSVSE